MSPSCGPDSSTISMPASVKLCDRRATSDVSASRAQPATHNSLIQDTRFPDDYTHCNRAAQPKPDAFPKAGRHSQSPRCFTERGLAVLIQRSTDTDAPTGDGLFNSRNRFDAHRCASISWLWCSSCKCANESALTMVGCVTLQAQPAHCWTTTFVRPPNPLARFRLVDLSALLFAAMNYKY